MTAPANFSAPHNDFRAALGVVFSARAAGLRLTPLDDGRLLLTGPAAARARWKPTIAARKPAILAALHMTSAWWRVTLPDRRVVEVAYSPPARLDEVLRDHPAARYAEPLPAVERDPAGRADYVTTAKQALRCSELLQRAREELRWTDDDARDFMSVDYARHPGAALAALAELLDFVRRERRRALGATGGPHR